MCIKNKASMSGALQKLAHYIKDLFGVSIPVKGHIHDFSKVVSG